MRNKVAEGWVTESGLLAHAAMGRNVQSSSQTSGF